MSETTRLTDEQIEHYRQQGYVQLAGVFSDTQLEAMERSFDDIVERRLRKREIQTGSGWGGEKWRQRYGAQKQKLFHTHDLQAYDALWARIITDPKFTQILADAMGRENVQLHHTKMFQKPEERGGAFPMHQDHPYFPHEQHTMMAAIIHLTDATEQMGCVCVYPGSHKLGPLEAWEHNHLNPDEYPIEKATPCPARRGDVLLFNYLTIHGSNLNLSQHVRKTVLVQARDPMDKPTADVHRSHAQGMMLRGVHPLSDDQTVAPGTLDSPINEVAAATER